MAVDDQAAAYTCTCGPKEYCAADDCHGARGEVSRDTVGAEPLDAAVTVRDSDEAAPSSAASIRLWLLDKLVGLWCWWKFGRA